MAAPWSIVNVEELPEEREPTGGYGTIELSEPLGLRQLRANLFRFGRGDRIEYHNHDWQEELIYVVDGACSLLVEGVRLELAAGDVARLAPLSRRQIVSDDPGGCVWFAVGAPPVDSDWNEFPEGSLSDLPTAAGGWSVLHAAELEPVVREHSIVHRLTVPLGLTQLHANLFRFRPGDHMRLHAHQVQEEVIYVLQGEVELLVGDERRSVKTGEIVRIGKEVPRQIRQPDGSESLWLALGAPPVGGDAIWVED